MGQTTPNMGIYIMAPGETNYDASFAVGMINVDQHDHSGGPNKGVPIASSGIADGSITYSKLNANVADNSTGIGTATGSLENQLIILGVLKNIFQASPGSGLITMDGTNIHLRNILGTSNQIVVTNGNGVGGNPTLSVPFGTAGFPGETISSFVPTGSGINLTTATPANITSIDLTTGTWSVTGLICYNGTITGAQYIASISQISATTGTGGLDTAFSNVSPTSGSDTSIAIPPVILTLVGSTTIYLVSNQVFTVGTLKGYGNITAVRLK